MTAPRRLMPLLPSTASSETPVPNTAPLAGGAAARLPRKKEAVSLACNRCRTKKSRCDGARPCSSCVRHGTECVYTTLDKASAQISSLKRKLSSAEEAHAGLRRLHELLRDRPHNEAIAIFRNIRRGDDPIDIVRLVEHGDVLLQMNLVPESRYRYEFPFRKEMPSFLVRSRSRYLRSFLFEPPFLETESACDAPSDRHVKPYSAVTLIERLLAGADLSSWTTVPSSPEFLHRLMQTYFLHTWPVFTHFHKSLFLKDLRDGRHRFCSPLLVNVILAAACHVLPELPRRNEYWDPSNIGYLFLAETRRLLELEDGRDRLTTIQALLILNQTINEQAMDEISYRYLVQAVDMAKRMGLLGPRNGSLSAEWRVAHEFTAWAVFSWQAIVSYAKLVPPLLIDPPQTPIPDPGQDPDWYDELWVQYPLSPVVMPTLFPVTYHAQLKFRIILKDLAMMITSTDPNKRILLHQRAQFYKRLTAWYEELPPSLQAEKITLPSQLGVHFQYWAVITSLFENLVPADTVGLSLQGQSIEEIASEARCNFEILVRMYYLRHGFDMYNTWAFFFLTSLCFVAIRELQACTAAGKSDSDGNGERKDTDEVRSTLILASKGISNQGRCYYLAEAMLRTICMQMDPKDVDILKQYGSFQDIDSPEVTAQRLRLTKSGWQMRVASREDEKKKEL